MDALATTLVEDEKPTFFSLPREIRDMIYELACEGVEVEVQNTTDRLVKHSVDKRAVSRRNLLMGAGTAFNLASNPNLGMLQTCSQMRKEAQPIYFQHTIFVCSGASDATTWLQRYISPALMGKMRHIRIRNADPASERSRLYWIQGQPNAAYEEGVIMILREEGAARLSLAWSMLGSRELAVLSPDAMQVMVVGKDMKVVWTSDPEGEKERSP